MGSDAPGSGGGGMTADDLMSMQTRQQSDQEDQDLAKLMEERRKKREADAARVNLGQSLWQTSPDDAGSAGGGFGSPVSESAGGPQATKERKWW